MIDLIGCTKAQDGDTLVIQDTDMLNDMTSRRVRSLPLRPVLDDDTRDAMVLGFARTEAGALRIARKAAKEREMDGVIGVRFSPDITVSYDPDLNSRVTADRANKAGGGLVMTHSAP